MLIIRNHWPACHPGQAVFATTFVALGILGLSNGSFAPVWQSIPNLVAAREFLGYLCSVIYLASGLGLLWPRTAALAARVLLIWLLLWMLLFKVPYIVLAPAVEGSYQSCAESAVPVAAAWVLYICLASDFDRRHFGFALGFRAMRAARVLFALALIAFGLSHWVYLANTAPLVPRWLPAPVFWAYFTGATYLAAAGAVLIGFGARLAVTLSAWQMGLFTALVWLPRVASGGNKFQWSELVISWTLTAAAWVVADSYRSLEPTRAPDAGRG